MNKHTSRKYVSLLMSPLLLAACSEDVREPPVSAGGNSTGGAPAAAGSASGGRAGAPAGGSNSTGGARGGLAGVAGGGAGAGGGARAGSAGAAGKAGTAGSSGSGGTAGSSGTSGAGGGGNAGRSGGGGNAGSTGTGGAGGGGAAGQSGGGGNAGSTGTGGAGGAGLLSLAAEFNPFRVDCPCKDANHFGLDKQDNCDSLPEVDRQTHVKHLAGDPNVVYDVKLHVRGLTEPNTYVAGELQGQRFYTGGRTSASGYTAYMLTVSDPEEVYFFNYNPTVGHLIFVLDYEVVIPMKGGATVTFEVNGGESVPDGHGVSNRERLVVPGVPPAPEPFNGQFVQFDVVTVEPQR